MTLPPLDAGSDCRHLRDSGPVTCQAPDRRRQDDALLPFAQRLAERRDRDLRRLSQAARKYRRVKWEIPVGDERRAREFNVSARFLIQAAANPGLKRRLPEFADALVRNGSIDFAPGRPGVLLLCGLYGQPLLAFLPSRGTGSASRASLSAMLEETLRVDHDLRLGIAHPVPHLLPGVGPGHLVPATGILSDPPREAFAALLREDFGATAMLDLAAREAVRDLSPTALQTLVLRRLFTNDWESPWDRQLVDVQGRCWPLDLDAAFPDDRSLLLSLSAMQHFQDTAPLFQIPEDDSGVAWEQALDPALAAKVLGIDTRQLYQTLMSDLACRRRHSPARSAGEAPDAAAQHAAVWRSVDAIRVVQQLIKEDPTLSLRLLLERFPHRLDWLDDPSPHRFQPAPTPTQRSKPTPAPSHAVTVDAGTPSPTRTPPLIGDLELSGLLRKASPFSPFKKRDKELAPLLRDAIALRWMKDGPKRVQAAVKLRDAAIAARKRVQSAMAQRRALGQPPADTGDFRLPTLLRLIHDIETRHDLPAREARTEAAETSGRSWLPWRRRAQRQA